MHTDSNHSSSDDDVFISDILFAYEQAAEVGHTIDIAKQCEDRPHLISMVRSRIEALERMNQLLGNVHRDCSLDVTMESSLADLPAECGSPSQLETNAEFEILRRHARGGLGEVLLAQQKHLNRQVAIKIIQAPFDRDPIRRRRFLREAEITARLQHPGVVPVYGMGIDKDGRPCYAMRFVEGETLQSAIEAFHHRLASLSTKQILHELRQLLERFVSVCNTIGYAHDRGILHRDIKPSNIMLGKFRETLVVDWGLAKELRTSIQQPNSTGPNSERPNIIEVQPDMANDQMETKYSDTDEQLTQHGGVLGTPFFMSPEQGSGKELTPSSDIYSLGATLCTILAGSPPKSRLYRQESETTACEPPAPLSSLRMKPLIAICSKAMRFDPTQRYASTLHLAADVERWLADEPVSVYRGDFGERFSRWVRHHRAAAVACLAIASVILVSLFVLAIQMNLANRSLTQANHVANAAKNSAQAASELAQANAKVADEQSRIAVAILHEVIQDIQRQLIRTPASQDVRRSILQKSMSGLERVSASLDLRPEVDRNVLLARLYLADVYSQIGSDSEFAGLQEAQKQLLLAREIANQLIAADPQNWSYQLDLGNILNRLGSVASQIGTAAEAEAFWRESLAIRERAFAHDPKKEDHFSDYLNALNMLGDYYVRDRSLAEASKLNNKAYDLIQAHIDSNSNLSGDRMIDVTLNNYASLKLRQGATDDAISILGQSLERSRRMVASNANDRVARSDLAFVLTMFGRAHSSQGDYRSAEPFYLEALELRDRNYRQEPDNLRSVHQFMQGNERMGGLMLKLGRLPEAKGYFETMMTLCERLLAAGPDNLDSIRNLSVAYERMAAVLWEVGQRDEAIGFFEKSLESDRERMRLDPSDPRTKLDVADSLAALGMRMIELDRSEDANLMLTEAVEKYRDHVVQNADDVKSMRTLAEICRNLSSAQEARNHFIEARESLSEATQLLEKVEARDPNNAAVLLDRAVTLYDQGRFEMEHGDQTLAKTNLRAALDIMERLSQMPNWSESHDEWKKKIEHAFNKIDTSDDR